MENVASLVVLLVVALAAGSIIVSTLRLGISPMPTSRKVRAAMLSLLPERTTGVIHELGAGWGGLAVAIARRCPQARVIAWELSPLPFLVCWLRAKGVPNLEVRRADFRTADLSQATVLVCYLFTGAMRALDERLRRERPGEPLTLVTNTFLLHGWPEDVGLTVDDLHRSRVVRYRSVPRRS